LGFELVYGLQLRLEAGVQGLKFKGLSLKRATLHIEIQN